VTARGDAVPKLFAGDAPPTLREVSSPLGLKPGTWARDQAGLIVCFDLPQGKSRLAV